MTTKETPKFRNNTNATKHTNMLMDTKSLLSDHIKKHVKTARNPSPSTVLPLNYKTNPDINEDR